MGSCIFYQDPRVSDKRGPLYKCLYMCVPLISTYSTSTWYFILFDRSTIQKLLRGFVQDIVLCQLMSRELSHQTEVGNTCCLLLNLMRPSPSRWSSSSVCGVVDWACWIIFVFLSHLTSKGREVINAIIIALLFMFRNALTRNMLVYYTVSVRCHSQEFNWHCCHPTVDKIL